ncbi:MAG: tetratricopeptide repeat protein [Pseudomonadota bacterium]
MSDRLSIKDIRSPDKFFKAMLSVVGYLRHNVKVYLIASAAVVLIVGVMVAIDHMNQSREEKARQTLYELTLRMQETGLQGPDDVIKVIQPVLEKLGNTNAGIQARYLLAGKYYEKNDWDNAVKNYGAVIDKSRGLIKELSLIGSAYSKENKGDINGALGDYSKVKDIDASSYKPVAMLGMGRCYQKLGDKNKALSSYETVVISYPDTDYARIASVAKTSL